MSITSIKRDWGVSPSIVRITSTDDLATITTNGYLDSERNNIVAINDGDFQWEPTDLILIYYFDNQWSFFSRNSSNNLTVVISGGSGDVQPFNIQQQTYTFADDDGTANAYHADYTPAIGAYVKGMRLTFNTANANTGASTFAVNGLSAVPIVSAIGDPLSGGEIPADSNVDVMLRDDGDWQLMGTSSGAGGVTPADVQSEAFTYGLDTSTGPDAYVVDYTPAMTTSDGTRFDVLINGTGTNTSTSPSITVNGMTYGIFLESGNSVSVGDIVLGVVAQFQLLFGNALLLNPQTQTITPNQIQNWTFSSAIDIGSTNAYVGVYSPTPVISNSAILQLTLDSTNTITNPTLDIGDGNGPTEIVSADGNPVPIGALVTQMNALFSFNPNYGKWQLLNPFNNAESLYLKADLSTSFNYTTGTAQVLVFDTSNQIPNTSWYDSGTGIATIPLDGTLAFTFNAMATPATIGRLYATLNGTEIASTGGEAADSGSVYSGLQLFNFSVCYPVNVGDVFQVNFNATGSGFFYGGTPGSDQFNITSLYIYAVEGVGVGVGITPKQIQEQAFVYDATATNVLDNYIVTTNPPTLPLTTGSRISFKVPSTNTTTSPGVNVNGMGLASIVNNGNSAVNIGDMVINCNAELTLNTNGNWQLVNPASGAGVTPDQIQQQAFVYGVAGGTGDAITLTVAGMTALSYVDGMAFEFRAPGNNVGLTPSIDVNGLGPITILGSDGQALLPASLIGSGTYRITYSTGFGGGFVLHNPSRGTYTSALLAQQMYPQFAGNTGPANAYVGAFTPVVTFYQTGQMFILSIGPGLTNTVTSVTFDAGAGALPVRLSSGAQPAIGDIQENGTYFFTVTDSGTEWQLLNPTLSNGGATPQISGTFTPQLRNYTLDGGLGLVSTGHYVVTGSNLFVTMEFSNSGGYIVTSPENGNFSNLPALPISPVSAPVITNGGPTVESDFYDLSTATTPYGAFGIATIVQSGITYIAVSTDNSFMFAFSVDQTNTAPGFELTPIGGAQAVFAPSSLIYPFTEGGTNYTIAINNDEDTLMTMSFNAGTITDVSQVSLTTNSLGYIGLFTISGVQYCVVLEDNAGGTVNGEFLETFQWTGSTWTSIDYFDTTVQNLICSNIVYDGATPYLITLDISSNNIYSYKWTGSTWTTVASAITAVTNPIYLTSFTFNGEVFFVVTDNTNNVYLYKWTGSAWNQEYSTTFGSGGFYNLKSLYRNGTQYVQAVSVAGNVGIWTLYYNTTSQLQNLASFSDTSLHNFKGQETAFNIGSYSYMFATSGGLGSASDVGGYAYYDAWGSTDSYIPEDGVGFFRTALDSFTFVKVQATYQIAGLGSVTIPNAVIQSYSTLLAPLTYSSGTNQTYVFDAVTGATSPVTYDGVGNFTFPGSNSKTWEIVGQFLMSSNPVDNMRLHISSPFSTDIYFSSPVAQFVSGAWCYINWRGTIAPGAVMQVVFDASGSGQFENGAGVTSYMTIMQI